MRIKIHCLLSVLLISAIMFQFLLPKICSADFFKYKDDRGALIITNKFEDIPKKYRNRVKVLWDADMNAKDPVARRRAAAKEQFERQDAAKKVGALKIQVQHTWEIMLHGENLYAVKHRRPNDDPNPVESGK